MACLPQWIMSEISNTIYCTYSAFLMECPSNWCDMFTRTSLSGIAWIPIRNNISLRSVTLQKNRHKAVTTLYHTNMKHYTWPFTHKIIQSKDVFFLPLDSHLTKYWHEWTLKTVQYVAVLVLGTNDKTECSADGQQSLHCVRKKCANLAQLSIAVVVVLVGVHSAFT